MKPDSFLSQQCDTNQDAFNDLLPILNKCSFKVIDVIPYHTVEYTGETRVA